MKICPECHKISKDDDFCSHCGSAVYGHDDHSSSAEIDCDNYKGHTHEKQSYDTYTRPQTVKKAVDKKKKNGCSGLIFTIFIILMTMGALASEDGEDILIMLETAIELLLESFAS